MTFYIKIKNNDDILNLKYDAMDGMEAVSQCLKDYPRAIFIDISYKED